MTHMPKTTQYVKTPGEFLTNLLQPEINSLHIPYLKHEGVVLVNLKLHHIHTKNYPTSKLYNTLQINYSLKIYDQFPSFINVIVENSTKPGPKART